MNTNQALQALLRHAHLICLVKFQAVEKTWGKDHHEVKLLHENYHTLFNHFANPNLWKQQVPFTAGTTTKLILDFDQVDTSKQATYLAKAKKLLTHLEEDLLKQALADLVAISTSTWNLKMLNALRAMLQEIDGRKIFFKSKGTDLDKHNTFPEMEHYQNQVVATYRSLLMSNALQATEAKVNNVKKRQTMIAGATELPLFLTIFEKWTAYIHKQIKQTSLLPHFAERPSNKNTKALSTLSRILVELDQHIAHLATQGKDLTQESDFSTLESEQQQLVKDYHTALLSNTQEAKDSQINAITQLGANLTSLKEIAPLKSKYKAINDWIRTATS